MKRDWDVKNTFYRSALKSSTALFAVAAIAAPAMAQEPAVAQDNDDAVLSDQPIVITGSRISNPNLVQSSPVQVVGESEINLRQATTAEELIGELPGISPGTNNAVNNGSAGFASLNLRNLGTQRNLVLLDGTRLVPTSTGGVVDLNIIPLALIERVDVLTGGASSTYGADAISGVANFVLKQDFTGMELTGTAGINERGDGFRYRADLVLGAGFDDGRGNAAFSVGYQKNNDVLQADRAISRDTLFIDGSSVGSGTSVPTRVLSDIDLINPNFDAPDPDDRTNNLATNQYDPATGAFVPTYNTFNFAPYNYFLTPLERFNVFGTARYEISPAVEVYTRGMFTKSFVDLQLAPSGLFGDTYQLPISNPFLNDTLRQQICAGQGFVRIPNPNFVSAEATPDEPMMVAGPDRIIDAATCSAAGSVTDTNGDGSLADEDGYLEVPVTINRRLVEQGARQTTYTTNQFQLWTGVRGDISPTISYDVYATYGESDRSLTRLNWGLKSRVQDALRAVDASTCETDAAGCSPLNLFGDGTSISDASVAYFNQPASLNVKTSLFQLNASVNGDLGETGILTDTPIGFAIGAEYRDTSASQIADVATGTQDEVLGTGAPSPSFTGRYFVKEVFGEVIVPILEDVPGFYSLTAEGGIRYSDYSNTGESVTWKAGATWEPIEGYRLRGVYQKSVRSPNIGELFLPVTTGLTALATDPCAGTNPVGDTALTNICLAQGAPAASIGNISQPSASQSNATSGGNPNLDVEEARSYTLGVILQPPQVPGLAITADYYHIKVTDAITTPTPGDILDPCFEGTNTDQCQFLQRNPLNGSVNGGGDTPGLILQLTNQGTIETSGVDLRVAYAIPMNFGSINLDFSGNWVDELLFQASPTSINRECVGLYSENCEPITPEYSFNLRTTVRVDDLVDLSLLWTWLDGVEIEDADGVLPEYSSIDPYHYFDLSARYYASENFELTVGIYNLFDRDPPNVSSYVGSSSYNSGNTYPTTYDVLGRRYAVTGRVRF